LLPNLKPKHLITTTFEAEIEKADGTRYVDNESIVTDKKKIIVLAQGQIELGKELNLIIHAYTEFLAKSVWIRNDYD
jgi:hypothetical protein